MPLQVITAGGTKIKATVVGTDVEKDLALIKVQTTVIKSAASFGKIDGLQVLIRGTFLEGLTLAIRN